MSEALWNDVAARLLLEPVVSDRGRGGQRFFHATGLDDSPLGEEPMAGDGNYDHFVQASIDAQRP